MDKTKDIAQSFSVEISALEGELAKAFEDTFSLELAEWEFELDGTAFRVINSELGNTVDQFDDESQAAWKASLELAKLAGKSITKNRVLVHTAFAMMFLGRTRIYLKDGDFARAVGTMTAFAMCVGNASSSASEWVSKSGPGKKGAAKRKDIFSRQVDAALDAWRKEISPSLSAAAAAERLRVKGVGLSFDKLARVIAAEKKKK